MYKPDRKLSIAICGTRGIPAAYGGFETFAEQLAIRLAERGHDVTVFNRRHLFPERATSFRGASLISVPTLQHKFFETPVHALLSFLVLAQKRADVAVVCNAANSPFLWILKAARIPSIVNVDGIERRRAKWNWLGRAWYRLGERTSVWFADRIVSDADIIESYYLERYGVASSVIAYGFDDSYSAEVRLKVAGIEDSESDSVLGKPLAKLGLRRDAYILYVSRLEPENNAHVVIEAYNRLSNKPLPLVIVGDAPYAREYIDGLKRSAGDGVIFCGYQFGDSYRALQIGARIYIQASEVGGTHPALVESMGFANAIVANDVPEHREVVGPEGCYYRFNDAADLSTKLEELLSNPALVASMRKNSRARAEERFSWESVVDSYEALAKQLSAR
jgi:glycosyltransferase involved in cell wall biosynthesis